MFGDMMNKLKEAQAKVEETKKRLDTVTMQEKSSDDLLKVTITGNREIKNIEVAEELLEDKEHAKNIADAGYEYVMKNLTWDELLPKYIKFYENLVNS